jgi:hypothetical protein
MDEFVGECRREWKRLGVRRSAIEEMSAELQADLREGSLDEVLGIDAGDATGFARRWALERGVTRKRKTAPFVAALAALAIVPAVIGAVLLIHDSDPTTASPPLELLGAPPSAKAVIASKMAERARVEADFVAHNRAVLLNQIEQPGTESSDSDTLGIALLIAGLAVLVPVTLLWSRRLALTR